jgi:hypothetical protein
VDHLRISEIRRVVAQIGHRSHETSGDRPGHPHLQDVGRRLDGLVPGKPRRRGGLQIVVRLREHVLERLRPGPAVVFGVELPGGGAGDAPRPPPVGPGAAVGEKNGARADRPDIEGVRPTTRIHVTSRFSQCCAFNCRGSLVEGTTPRLTSTTRKACKKI